MSSVLFQGADFSSHTSISYHPDQDDIRTAVDYFFEGYERRAIGRAFVGASKFKWSVAVTTQFLEGVLGLGTTFLLIITSDDVVGLMLDFTAVEVSAVELLSLRIYCFECVWLPWRFSFTVF